MLICCHILYEILVPTVFLVKLLSKIRFCQGDRPIGHFYSLRPKINATIEKIAVQKLNNLQFQI